MSFTCVCSGISSVVKLQLELSVLKLLDSVQMLSKVGNSIRYMFDHFVQKMGSMHRIGSRLIADAESILLFADFGIIMAIQL